MFVVANMGFLFFFVVAAGLLDNENAQAGRQRQRAARKEKENVVVSELGHRSHFTERAGAKFTWQQIPAGKV